MSCAMFLKGLGFEFIDDKEDKVDVASGCGILALTRLLSYCPELSKWNWTNDEWQKLDLWCFQRACFFHVLKFLCEKANEKNRDVSVSPVHTVTSTRTCEPVWDQQQQATSWTRRWLHAGGWRLDSWPPGSWARGETLHAILSWVANRRR